MLAESALPADQPSASCIKQRFCSENNWEGYVTNTCINTCHWPLKIVPPFSFTPAKYYCELTLVLNQKTGLWFEALTRIIVWQLGRCYRVFLNWTETLPAGFTAWCILGFSESNFQGRQDYNDRRCSILVYWLHQGELRDSTEEVYLYKSANLRYDSLLILILRVLWRCSRGTVLSTIA